MQGDTVVVVKQGMATIRDTSGTIRSEWTLRLFFVDVLSGLTTILDIPIDTPRQLPLGVLIELIY